MGDKNQILYLEKFCGPIDGPILEIGSKDYGSTSSFRSVYPSNEYVGVDMAEGKGVDKVIDLAEGIGDLEPGRFKLIVCCSVLEHVAKPWKMAENITTLLAAGGQVYMSVPWIWRYHAYPDDYFRFSASGIRALFPDLTWRHPTYSTNLEGEFISITKPGIDDDYCRAMKVGDRHRKYMPYLMLNMMGSA